MVGGMGYRFIFIGMIARPCNPCRGVESHCFQNFCAGAMDCTYLLYKVCVPCRRIIGMLLGIVCIAFKQDSCAGAMGRTFI